MYASQRRVEGLEGDNMSSMDEPSRQIEVVQAAHRSGRAPRACHHRRDAMNDDDGRGTDKSSLHWSSVISWL